MGKSGCFFPRDNSHFTRQVANFTRSWSSGLMLAFQPRGFVFEPVGMRFFFTSIPKQKFLTFFGTMRLFGFVRLFSKFFKCPQRVLSIFFDILQQNECLKSQRVPFFAHDEVNVHCSPAKKVFFHNSQLHNERLLEKSQNPREIRTCSLPIARHKC